LFAAPNVVVSERRDGFFQQFVETKDQEMLGGFSAATAYVV
jgi:hypothetical protein